MRLKLELASVEKAAVVVCVLLRMQTKPPAPDPDAYDKSDWPCYQSNLATIKTQMPTVSGPHLFELRAPHPPYVRLGNTEERAELCVHVLRNSSTPLLEFMHVTWTGSNQKSSGSTVFDIEPQILQ